MKIIQTLILVAGLFFSVWGYSEYFKKIKKSDIQPNKWSWLIWSLSIFLESVTYAYVSGDILKTVIFFTSAFSCVFITGVIWNKMRYQRPDRYELFSAITCVLAITVWIIFQSALWAHLILLIALPIAFIPTYKDAWRNFKSEDTKAWILWSIGDLLVVALVFLRLEKKEEIPYAVVEFICHIATWLIVLRGKIKIRK